MRSYRKPRRGAAKSVSAPGGAAHCVEKLERRMLLSAAIAAFQTQQVFPTGADPVALAVADLNRDGKPDLIVANNTDGTVGVLLGDGTGSFLNQQTFACGANPFAIAVADVNGDGKPDLIVANYTSSRVSVLLGNGDGTFGPPHSFATGNGPIALTTADVNGDGKPDILVANYSSGTVSVLDGNGDGTFQNQQTFAAGKDPISIAAADLNDDGKTDIAVSNYTSSTVSVLLGTGTGSFSAPQSFAVGGKPRDLAISDVNRDGKPDLAVVNKTDGTASILLGNGDGTFQAQTTFAVGPSPNAIAVADVNGDGKEDLVVAGGGTAYPAAAVLLGNGDGTFQPTVTFATGSNPYALTVADLNGDGRLDLATVNQRDNTVSVLLGDVPPTVLSINRTNPPGPIVGPGSVTYTVTFNEPVTGVDPSDFTLQLNGATGMTPVVVSGSGAVYTVTINGVAGTNGTLGLNLIDNGRIKDAAGNPLQPGGVASFQPQHTFAALGYVQSMQLADVNGDGRADLIVAGQSGVSVLLGNGNGTFLPGYTVGVGDPGFEQRRTLAVADVNGDGKPDLIVGNYYANDVAVLLGNGNGTFQAPLTFANTSPYLISVADINGDGRPDLVIADLGPNAEDVSVLLGNGNGTFQSAQTVFHPLSNRFSFTVADVNGDGKPDLLVAQPYGYYRGISLLLGNGNGTFKAPQTLNVGGSYPVSPRNVAVADVNGDGNSDLVAGQPTTSVLLGNGNGTFQARQTFFAGDYQSAPVVCDLNGDGKPDVVLSNDNSVSVLLGNGNGTFQARQTFAAPGATTNVAAVAADLNNDGRADVVVGSVAGVSVLLASSDAGFAGQLYTVVNGPQDEIFGTSGNDTIRINRAQSSPDIVWGLNGGPAFGDIPINDPNGLTINGDGGNDTIVLDYTYGNPLPNILHLNGSFTITGLQGTNPLAGVTLDIGKSTVFINYANAASDPIAAIKGYLQAGYNNGGWNGSPTATTGVITSLAAAGNPNHNTAIGYADFVDGQGVNTTPNTIELTYTLVGDANLDHQVNSADLQILLAFLNRTDSWDQGDFNYDGQVNSADLQSLLFTLNTSLGNQAAPALAAANSGAAAQNQDNSHGTSAALTPTVSTKPAPTVHPKLLIARRAHSRPHR
ncbi:MAG TPA: FG-GAP-like repeat-containing protein [Tepidisphaeraceae bacterium]|nr:FG-GAP-like repeat-containing protein [Tepidisphaeraceae bacterium]